MPFFIHTVTILYLCMYVNMYFLEIQLQLGSTLLKNEDLALFQTQPRNKLAVSNEKYAIFVQLCFILQRLILSWLGQSLKIVDFIFITYFLAVPRKDARSVQKIIPFLILCYLPIQIVPCPKLSMSCFLFTCNNLMIYLIYLDRYSYFQLLLS